MPEVFSDLTDREYLGLLDTLRAENRRLEGATHALATAAYVYGVQSVKCENAAAVIAAYKEGRKEEKDA